MATLNESLSDIDRLIANDLRTIDRAVTAAKAAASVARIDEIVRDLGSSDPASAVWSAAEALKKV